jgi:hypothetical protein
MDSSAPSSDGRRTEFRLLKPMPSRLDPAGSEGAALREQPWDTQIRRLFPPREAPAAKLPPVQGIQLGHFEIEERIARGGMGTVFLARDLRLDRVVALKVLSQEQLRDPAAVQRFQNEARAAAKLDHENIARVYFVGEDRGVHFIAFEYVRGTTVREAVAAQGVLSQDDAVNYTLQATEALRHLDAAGVVHRDIKPSNLIVTPSGRVKLVDLGLARQTAPTDEEDLTVTGTTLGTFDYISPEQARDPRNVDIRSDIYSLGCTLYQMLTGSPPYPRGSSVEKLLQHSAGRPPDPVEVNPRISPRLSLVVQRMMASSPDERYASPQALIDELSDLADDLGLRATAPEGTIWRKPIYAGGLPWWDRHRGWMIAAAAIVLLAVMGSDAYRWVNSFRAGADASGLNGVALQPGSAGQPAPRFPATVPDVALDADPTPAPAPRAASLDPSQVAGAAGAAALQSPASAVKIPSAAGTVPDDSRSESDRVGFDGRNLGETTVQSPTLTAAPSVTPATVGSAVPPPSADPATPATTAESGVRPPLTPAMVGAESPFVLIDAEGLTVGRFQSLEAACHVAKTGGVVEIHHDGPLALVQKPVLIQGKRLTIRPAAGRRPQLAFAPASESLGSTQARLIEVVNGSLELYDVDLRMAVSNNLYAEEWVLLSLTRVRDVVLQRVTMTAVNPGWRPAVLVERRMPSDAPTVMMPAVEPMRESQIQIQDCLFRGNATCYSDRAFEPAAVQISDSAVSVDADVVNVQGADRAEMDGVGRVPPVVRIEFDHVTAVAGESLVRVSTETVRDLPEVRIDCRNSILQANSGKAPFLVLEGHQDSDVLLQRLRWLGNRNVIVTEGGDACVVRGLYPRGEEWTYSLGQWQAQWQPDWEIATEAITSQSVLVWQPSDEVSLSELQRNDFALKQMSINEPANPAQGTASDNSDRGFRPSLSQLPPAISFDAAGLTATR